MKTNGLGMTLEDWASAAGYGEVLPRLLPALLKRAWRADEDPTDYRHCNPFPYLCLRCGNTVQASQAARPETRMCSRCQAERTEFRRELPEAVESALRGLDEDAVADIRGKAFDLRVPLTGYKRRLDALPELVLAADVLQE